MTTDARPHARRALPHASPGEQVRLQGWVHRRRELAALTFLVVRDRSGLAQVVVKDGQPSASRRRPRSRSSVPRPRTRRRPVASRSPTPTITAARRPADTPPIELWRPTLDTRAADAARPRRRHVAAPAPAAAWELAAASLHGFRSTLDASGFTEVHSPKLVESATESGANVFAVDYFGRPAYLAQRPQFYKQVLVGVFERVYEVGPVFRAEPHDTVRHLAEYVSLDVELGFIEDHREVVAVPARRRRRHGRGHPRAGRRCRRAARDRRAARARSRCPLLHFREALRDRRCTRRRARPRPGARARAR